MHQTAHGPVLDYPTDLRGFTHRGIRMDRQNALHEEGVYLATDPSGAEWCVSGIGGTKRKPWTICRPVARGGTCVGYARNLIQAAETIAALSKRERR
jgi:hypothetical protein